MENVRIIMLESEEELEQWSRHLYFNNIQWMYSFVRNSFKKVRKIIFTCTDEKFKELCAKVKEDMYALR